MARKRRPDPKEAALAETRTLNPRPEAVRDEEFGSSEFFDARDLVQVKYEMVRRVRVDGAPVTQAAAAFGFSRPSYYEAAAAVQRDGLGALVSAKPGPRRAHKLTDEVVAFARSAREADPSMTAAQLATVIAEKFAITVRPTSSASTSPASGSAERSGAGRAGAVAVRTRSHAATPRCGNTPSPSRHPSASPDRARHRSCS